MRYSNFVKQRVKHGAEEAENLMPADVPQVTGTEVTNSTSDGQTCRTVSRKMNIKTRRDNQ
jgi:hypothetical protein